MRNLLDFEYSPWLIALCLAAGVGYAWLQYKKPSPWSSQVNYGLAAGRVVLVTLLAILLLGPTIIAVRNYYEKPVLVMAIDDSESVALASDTTERLKVTAALAGLRDKLTGNGWQVKLVGLAGAIDHLDSLQFNQPRSDLTGMVKSIHTAYDGANLGAILLVSDGIFNSGFSPDFISTFTPIYALGLGDTVPHKDLAIIAVRHNKTVYQDNRFPVAVAIRNEALGPGATMLRIFMGNTLVGQAELKINPDVRIIEHQFTLKATQPGKQRLTITLDAVAGEATMANNRAGFYIDVIEGRQQVLLVADAPVPDIKALRLAIGKNEHFAVTTAIDQPVTGKEYDLVILVQTPHVQVSSKAYQAVMALPVPKLFIIGSLTDVRQLNRDGVVSFNRAGTQTDWVTAVLNPDFTGFTLAEDPAGWLAAAPPLAVPFGSLVPDPVDEVVLYQQVGTVATSKPLLYVATAEPRKGVIFGEGLWKWRLNEFRVSGQTKGFDELITKVVMYLAARPDNRQFKMYPQQEDYEVGDEIVFLAETYNELFEPVYGEPVSLKITGDDRVREYSFIPLAGSRELRLDDLPEGVYNYVATTSLNGKVHRVRGQFLVERPDLEAADLTADYVTLRRLADESGGKFYLPGELTRLEEDLAGLTAPAIIHSRERELMLLNLPWILALLITLATGEWLLRKMLGGY